VGGALWGWSDSLRGGSHARSGPALSPMRELPPGVDEGKPSVAPLPAPPGRGSGAVGGARGVLPNRDDDRQPPAASRQRARRSRAPRPVPRAQGAGEHHRVSVHRRASAGFSRPATAGRPGKCLRAGVCRPASPFPRSRPHPAGHRAPEAVRVQRAQHHSDRPHRRAPRPSDRPHPGGPRPQQQPTPRPPLTPNSSHSPQPRPTNSEFTPPAAAPQPTARCRPATGSPTSGTPG